MSNMSPLRSKNCSSDLTVCNRKNGPFCAGRFFVLKKGGEPDCPEEGEKDLHVMSLFLSNIEDWILVDFENFRKNMLTKIGGGGGIITTYKFNVLFLKGFLDAAE